MHVYDQRTDVSRLLRAELDSSSLVVSSPDHPLLLEGPDVIVGGEGGLLAVYFPKALERARPERLGTRFTLSRLALPAHARHVLVLDQATKAGDFAGLGRNFVTVLGWSQRKDLAPIARDPGFSGGLEKVPDEVATYARQRFADALQTTLILRRLEGPKPPPARSGAAEGRRKKDTPYEHLSEDILFKDLSWRPWNSAQVQSIANRTTLVGFALDNGVPYPTNREDYGVVLVEDFKDYRGDPEKLLRAAAFAGWGVVPAGQRHRIQAVAERLAERRVKRRPK